MPMALTTRQTYNEANLKRFKHLQVLQVLALARLKTKLNKHPEADIHRKSREAVRPCRAFS